MIDWNKPLELIDRRGVVIAPVKVLNPNVSAFYDGYTREGVLVQSEGSSYTYWMPKDSDIWPGNSYMTVCNVAEKPYVAYAVLRDVRGTSMPFYSMLGHEFPTLEQAKKSTTNGIASGFPLLGYARVEWADGKLTVTQLPKDC